jgi:uncharacterized protein (TIGR02285 family)
MLWIAAFNLSMIICFKLSAKEVLTWRVIDWPPFYILHGKDKGEGIYDKLIKHISTELPEYEHRTMVMNTKRVLAEMNAGSHVCHPSALSDTEAILSVANSFLLPHRIIFDSTARPELNNKRSISISNLMSKKNFKIGVASDRYPITLNHVLDRYRQKSNFINQNNYNSLIRMFFRKRVDALIEYPPVINYSKRFLNETMHNSSIAIEELNKTKYLPVHFACPNNTWGKEVINKINQILINETNTNKYLDFRLKWYDEKSQKLLKKYYQEDYLNDKK